MTADPHGIGLLAPDALQFSATPGGFLNLTYNGREYHGVTLSRILPYDQPDRYISVSCEKEELGILQDIAQLSPQQAELVREELARRYFSPKILDILSLKERMGYLYAEVALSTGRKAFAVKDFSRNIRLIGEGRLVIFDVDGNRYTIDDLQALTDKARKRIEPYLF